MASKSTNLQVAPVSCSTSLLLLSFLSTALIFLYSPTTHAASKKSKACSAALKKIGESADFLLQNKGPDDEGRAHPTQRMTIEQLDASLEIARNSGLPTSIQPYHARNVIGLWTDRNRVRVLELKIDSLLNSPKYKGDLGKFIAEVTTAEIFAEPLIEFVSGKRFEISMGGIGNHFKGSVYSAIKNYLEMKALSDAWKDLKPYHLNRAGQGTWDQATQDEVLRKKVDSLLQSPKYQGNLGKLIAETDRTEFLTSPLTETINGHVFQVSMGVISTSLNDSTYVAIKHYLELTGQTEQWKDLRPYHLKTATQGTWDEATRDEVLKRKFASLLKSKKYGGDLGKLFAEVTTTELFAEPLNETINGHNFEISMDVVGGALQDSRYAAITKYLNLTNQIESWRDLRPYHLGVAGPRTWNDATCNEVIKKKIDSLLRSDKYKGNLGQLIAATGKDELFGMLSESVNGQPFEVSMRIVGQYFNDSPFQAITRYLETTGQAAQWSGLKPYHLKHASRDTWTEANRDEILKKKIGSLLYSKKYKGDLGKFIAETDGPELFETPLVEIINGHQFEISLVEIGNGLKGSTRLAINRYLELAGQADVWSGLRPHHLARASAGSWDEKTRDTVLKDKIDSLLYSPKYGGNLGKLIAETTHREIFEEPLIETVSGQNFEISMGQVARALQSSPYLAVRRYLELTGQADAWKELRPYHFNSARPGTWTEETRDDILRKRIDSLLRSDKYQGNLGKLIAETDVAELFGTPLMETVSGYSFDISLGQVGNSLQNSPRLAVQRYLEITQQADAWSGLKPYHFNRTAPGTWTQETQDEILKRKITLLRSEKYHGDLNQLLSETNQTELFDEPLIEIINGHRFEISMHQLGSFIQDSPYLAMKRYYQLVGKAFPFTPAVFYGSPETRARRMQGQLNAYDLRLIAIAEGKLDTSHFGFRQYNAVEKDIVRELILEEGLNFLGDRNIRYLGLETEQFGLLRLLGNYLNLNAPASTVIEMDARVVNAMKAIARSPRNGLKPLKNLQIREGNVDNVVPDLHGPYNLVNLDYVGHLSSGKQETLNRLLNNPELLEDKSLIVVTLANRPLDIGRAARAGFGEDQVAALKKIMTSSSPKNVHVEYVGTVSYAGGTDGGNSTPMITTAFRVTRTSK